MARYRSLFLVVLVVGMTLSAGCSGVMDSGPSVSNTSVQTADIGPELRFNYSIGDYTDVLLENPDGDIVNKGTLNPDKSWAQIYMGDPQGGTYEIILRQGGDTVTTKSVTFDGPQPHVADVSANWTGNVLHGVSITVENSGDLPIRAVNGSISVRDTSMDTRMYEWIQANGSTTLTVSPPYNAIRIEEPGNVRGDASLELATGTVSESFAKSFQGPNLEFVNTTPQWDGSTLNSVSTTVRNTGDMAASVEVSIYDGTESLDSSFSQTIGPGESAQFELNGFLSLYESSGGNVDLSLVANSSAGYAETSVTRSVASANLDLHSISPTWQGAELQTVDFRVQNVGDVTGSFTATVSVRGTEAGQASYQVDGGQTTAFTYGDGLASGYGPIYTVESGGDVPVTVTISSSSGSVSQTATKTFGDAEGSISDVDTTFIGRAGEDRSELTSVSFDVRNDGGIPLTYDAVEIEMDGATRTDSAISTQSVATGSERAEIVSISDGIVVSDGSHDLTIRLTRDGETVVSETTTVST